jgi:hypothetical protein
MIRPHPFGGIGEDGENYPDSGLENHRIVAVASREEMTTQH